MYTDAAVKLLNEKFVCFAPGWFINDKDEVYQAAVALYYLEDHSYRDIAVVLDVPIGTVKSRIARGIAQLRELSLTDSNSELGIANGHLVTRSGFSTIWQGASPTQTNGRHQ